MKVKLNIWDDDFKFELWRRGDKNKFTEKIDINEEDETLEELIPKDSKIQAVIECKGIWYAGGGRFGITWNLTQAGIDLPVKILGTGTSYLIDSSGEEEEEEEEEEVK